jgi:hypothetical protein
MEVSRKQVTVILTVEEKDDVTPDGIDPELPFSADVAVAIGDELLDSTEHNAQLGWRVVAVSNG